MKEFKSLKDTFCLSNGIEIPCIGFGTWQSTGKEAYDSVLEALKIGYRHIDTASIYGNEKEVGRAVKDSKIPREEIFITSKLWNSNQGYDTTLCSFEETLRNLCTDYLDLYLIHWPVPVGHKSDFEALNLKTWRAFERLYKEGLIRAIGVSNFLVHHLKPLIKEAKVKPMINQIEYHIGYTQSDIVEFCKNEGILVEAWAPLARGKAFANKTLGEISQKYAKTPAQISLRWILQNYILPLPKSVTPSRIKENSEIFSFCISDTDMNTLNKIQYSCSSGLHPDNIDF